MLRLILLRLLTTAAMAVAATAVVFLIANTVPGDPALLQLGELAASNPAAVQEWRHENGLDQPIWKQYAVFLSHLAHGDLGTSIVSQRPVLDDIKSYAPATVELATCGFILAIVSGVSLGVVAAVKRDTWIDHVVRAISLVGMVAPSFWLDFMMLVIFYGWLHVAPGPGRLDAISFPPPAVTGLYLIDMPLAGDWNGLLDAVWHLLLPSSVIAIVTMGMIARTTRASMLACMTQDYVRTGRAKGLSEWQVVARHVWPNAVIPVVTLGGVAYGNLLSGAVLTETIFSWPGLGRYTFLSASSLDFPAIMGVTLVVALSYLLVNLLVDISYPFLDPRIRR